MAENGTARHLLQQEPGLRCESRTGLNVVLVARPTPTRQRLVAESLPNGVSTKCKLLRDDFSRHSFAQTNSAAWTCSHSHRLPAEGGGAA